MSREVEIQRPRAEVVAYATNPDNTCSWYRNIEAVEWRSPPPAQGGSKVAFVASFLGRRLEYTYEIRELSDDRLVMRTADGPFPMQTTYTWVDAPGGGTRMTLRNSGEPSAFAKLARPLLAAAMSRAMAKDLRRLKAILER